VIGDVKHGPRRRIYVRSSWAMIVPTSLSNRTDASSPANGVRIAPFRI
jgi:hypothetical protein